MLCMPMQMYIKQCFNLPLEQKKNQKRKIEDDMDDDMDIEPQMKYKGRTHSSVSKLLKQTNVHGGSVFLCILATLFQKRFSSII